MVNSIKSICLVLLTAYTIAAQNNNQFIPAVGGIFLPCGPESDCMRFILNDDLDYINSTEHKIVGQFSKPLCSARKFRQLIAYDDSLLVEYTHEQIDSLIRIHHDFFKIGMDSSGIENYIGTQIVGLMPIKIPITYTSIDDVSNWLGLQWLNKTNGILKVKNDSLDADHLLIITHQNCPLRLGNTGVNTQMTTKPELPPDIYHTFWERNKGVVNFNVLFIKPTSKNTLGHEIGHGIGGDHEAPSNSSITPYYARAYRGDSVKTNTIVMCCGSNLVPRFSGPNSKVIKEGRTLTLGNDTINNARHISEVLNDFWCATENHITRVSFPTISCGSGKLQAITNNADTFQWKVLSGNCSITGDGQEINYMATSLSKIQVIAQKKGKWYWDTAVVEIPALQHTTLNSSIKQGEFFILPNKDTVYTSGSYTVTLKNQNGCDSLVTINLSVISSINKIDLEQIIILPNPVQEKLFIKKLNEYSHGCIISYSGIKRQVDLSQDEIDVVDLSTGTYILQLVKGNHILQQKFIKL